MSLVLCIITKDAIYFTSDGLVTNDKYDHLEEKRQKVFTMSKHTVLGYSGHLNSCLKLKNSIILNNVYKLPTNKLVEFSIKQAKKIYHSENKTIQFVVVGNDNNKFYIYGFSSEDNFKLYELNEFDKILRPICISMTSIYVPDDECDKLLKKYYDETNNLKETIKSIYHEIAKYDKTINENLYGYKIEKNRISLLF